DVCEVLRRLHRRGAQLVEDLAIPLADPTDDGADKIRAPREVVAGATLDQAGGPVDRAMRECLETALGHDLQGAFDDLIPPFHPFIVWHGADHAAGANQASRSTRRMRSSSGPGDPRPSVLFVRTHREASGATTTSRILPCSPEKREVDVSVAVSGTSRSRSPRRAAIQIVSAAIAMPLGLASDGAHCWI